MELKESIAFLNNNFVKNKKISSVTEEGKMDIKINVEDFSIKKIPKKPFYIPFFFKGEKDYFIITKNILACANIFEFITKKYGYSYQKTLSCYMIISFENEKENLDFIIKRLEKSKFKNIPIFIALTEENHDRFKTSSIKSSLNLYKIIFPSYIKKEEDIIKEYIERNLL